MLKLFMIGIKIKNQKNHESRRRRHAIRLKDKTRQVVVMPSQQNHQAPSRPRLERAPEFRVPIFRPPLPFMANRAHARTRQAQCNDFSGELTAALSLQFNYPGRVTSGYQELDLSHSSLNHTCEFGSRVCQWVPCGKPPSVSFLLRCVPLRSARQ